jgi:hypothetical protein
MYCGDAGHRRDNHPKGAQKIQRVREVAVAEASEATMVTEEGKEEVTQ